jgi:predicted nucleotidyltransferase
MTKASSIAPEAASYIRSKLDDLAEREGVRILFAIESGSRAWGFPSADSDYDVRFAYIRPRSDYLSVREFRDVLETPLENDEFLSVPLDLNGWDIRKALRLGLNSNPVLHEWLVSPIKYISDDQTVELLRDVVAQNSSREALRYHYDRLARRAWEQIETDPAHVQVKRYCYALRPVLMLRWLSKYNGLPPMDVASLCEDLEKPLASNLTELFALKYTSGESDLIERRPVLDKLIADALMQKAGRPGQIEVGRDSIEQADRVFMDLL